MKPTADSLDAAKKIIQDNVSDKINKLKLLNESEALQRTMAEIITDRKLSDQKKQDLCNDIFELYCRYNNV